MGALTERLELTLQDAKQWLKWSLNYDPVEVEVLANPTASTKFFVLIKGTKVVYTSGVAPTVSTVAAGIVAAIIAASITGITAIDLSNGKYRVTDSAGSFAFFVSAGQTPLPQTPDDYLLLAIIEAAINDADEYLNNPFATVDADGIIITGTEIDIPQAVKMGVLQQIDHLTADYNLGGDSLGPIKSRKVGDVTVQYATGQDIAGISSGGGLAQRARALLTSYRLMAGWRYPRQPLPGSTGDLSTMNPKHNEDVDPGDITSE